MSERNPLEPIRVAPGSLTIDPLFPSTAPKPPQPSPEQVAQVEDARRRDEELAAWQREQEAKAPGRYTIVDERDLAAKQEEWRKQNASGGVAGDTRRAATLGLDSTANALREVVRAIPKVGPAIVDGVDSIDRWMWGRDSETLFNERRERLTAGMTPEMRAAREKQWVEERQNPDGSTSYSMGSAWTDPRSYLSGLAESAAGTAITMVPGAILARGAYVGALARGATEKVAAAAAARTALIAGGISEGVIAGGQTSAEIREAIGKMPEATLQQSEAYRSLIEGGKTPVQARAALTDDLATKGMLIAGVATGIFGGQGDRALAKILAEGVQGGLGRRILSGAGRGVVAEGLLEELPQSVSEQMAKNYALQGADPNQRLMEGVPNAAAGGAVVGGLMGGGMGAAGAAARRNDAPAPAPAIPEPRNAAEAKGQAIGAERGAAPSGPLSSALEYATRQGGTPTTAPDGAPPPGTDVSVTMARGQRLNGRIEGYSPSGEPMVLAEIVDPETGEIRTQTLEVPLSQLAPLRPAAPPPPVPETRPEIVPEIVPGVSGTVAQPAPAQPASQSVPPENPAARPAPGTVPPQDVTAEAAAPVGRIAPTETSQLPPRKDTVPLTERPAMVRPGSRVIVDDPATVGRFGATLQGFSPDGQSAVVRGDGGQELEIPVDRLRVNGVSPEQQQARDLAENPPVERETITGTVPTAREVRGKQIVMPDEKHSRLYDLGKMRHDSKRTLGRGALDLDTDRPMAEQVALAEQFGVSPQRLAQLAEDYRYRVERAAKEATTRTPVKVPTVSDKMLARMKAEDRREEKKRPADPPVVGGASTQALETVSETGQLPEWSAIDAAANEAATSPTNDTPEPTEAQREAGNYKVGRLRLAGLDISIENPAGSTRSGTDPNGRAWSIIMKSHYGYFRGTRGPDKDHIDVFVKPGTGALNDGSPIFVIDQVSPDTKRFDEPKVMLGWQTAGQAKTAYLANYQANWKGLGTLTPTNIAGLKAWFADGDTTKPFADRNTITKEASPNADPQLQARNDGDAGARGVGAPKAEVPESAEPRLPDVRGTRDNRPSGVEEGLSGVLPGDRPASEPGTLGGPDGRDEGVRARERPVGDTDGASAQPPRVREERGEPDRSGGRDTSRPEALDGVREAGARDDTLPSADAGEGTGRDGSSSDQPRRPDDVGARLGAKARGKQIDATGATEPRLESGRNADPSDGPQRPAVDFSGNTFFTADKVEAARARLRAKMRQVNSGIDPETLIDGMTIAGAYIEAGVRSFTDYASRMVSDLGPNVRPYLLSFWEGTRHYPGLDTSGMTSAEESARLHQELMKAPAQAAAPAEEKADGQDAADAGDRGQLAADEAGPVRAPQGERNAGERAARRVEPDDVGDRRAGGRRDAPGRGDGEGPARVPDADEQRTADERGGSRSAGGSSGDVASRQLDAADGRGRAGAGVEPPTEPQPSGGLVAQARPTAYTITDADELGSGGAKAKFRNNVAAIRLLRKLEEEARTATRDEQSVLAKWVGWGGLRPAFARDDGSVAKGWEKEAAELRELMTPEEYRAAESSTRNAHYTAPEIVKAMWSAVDRLGFKGGQILEPSVGAGNFLGLAPPSVRETGRFTGVELDRITGQIAKNLYLDANIQAPMGFEALTVPEGYFDLAIGNPPFGSERVHDKLNRKIANFSIHNYFFAKSVDSLRPGGVLAMVITSRFLDGADTRARAYIAEKADLLGAIRLPNDAFLKNAGTSVTTDIVFLQRRADGVAADTSSWVDVGEYRDREGRKVPLNRYFIDNPDMMLGDFGAYGTMYGPDEPALIAREGDNLPQLVRKAINALPAKVMPAPAAPVVGETPKVPSNVRDALEGSMFLDPDGKIWRRDPDRIGEPQASPADLGNTAAARVAQMIRVRDTFARLRAAQLDPKATDEKIENLRERLNKVYDAHVAKFGPINADANKRLFREDPTWPQISALEDNFDKGISADVAKTTGETPRAPSAKKAAIFTKRTQQPYAPPTTAANAKDALAAVLSEYGRVDMRAMEQIYGQPEADIVAELGSLIFKTPAGIYETADGYLSGNVKQKLAEARRAAEQDPAFRVNVEALEAVQPADIEAVDIDVKSGSPWVPANHVADFINHIIDGTGSKAFYSKLTASWVATPGRASQSASTMWATEEASINRVIDAALNHSRITISYKNADGTMVVDQAATEAANEKVEKVKAEWRRWVWEDDARRDELARIYNDTFNTDVEPRFDGSHLKLPGKVSDDIISFRPHQLNAVWRATQTGSALFDHTVGAGKTFAGIASVMELRRTGRAKKPMVVVPNHLVGQWAADFIKLYPGARVLAPTEKDFDKENRQRLFARILTSDWDAVIVAHSSFKKIGVSAEYEAAYLQDQVTQIMASMQEVRAATGEKSRNVSQLSKQRDALQTRLQKLMEGGGKDAGLVWDDLGIDALMVDEAHEFKNLGFATSMQRVAGLGNPTGSQKASNLAIKIRHLLDKTGGRNLIFLTGTPLSNSMAEMFTVQRYLAGRKLEQMGLAHFDAWARVFGEVVTDWELSPTGQYKQNSRFARFTNVPELMQFYRSFADVIVNDDIKAMLAAQGKRFPLPKVKGGKPTNIAVERSPDQAEFIGIGTEDANGNLQFPKGSLIWRAENLPKKAEKGADNMLKIMSDARKAALDMRLIGQGYGDVANSKVHRAADEMVRIYKAWARDRGTQLVFIDLSTPQAAKSKEAERIRALIAKAEQGDDAAQEALDNLSPDELSALDGKFSVYDDLRQKLIDRGIPPEEIAFIHSANTDLQKQELFGKVRSGRIRFLFGSTPKMGAGTNVQNRLVALHHLDAPWRPSDLEQRDGRGIRQGNELYEQDPDGFEIEILRYATKNTLDARQWQTIEAKARFIEQLRKGNVKERTVEDIGGEASNAAEMKAAASGNPLILEEMTLRQRLRKLDAAMVEHERGQHRVKGAIGASMRETNRIETMMPDMEKDAAAAAETLAGEFTATIRGAKMEKPSEMGLAILNAAKEMLESGAERSPVGSYGPFKLTLQWAHTTSFRLNMAGAMTHEISVGDVKEADPNGLGLKITNTARWLVKEPDQMKARLAALRAELPKLQAQIGPFPQAAEFEETRQKHTEIMAALRPKPKPPAAKPEDAPKDSVKDMDPVATITGAELGVEFRGGEDLPALRTAALAWYKANLMGTTVLMKDGTEVQFGGRGRNKSANGRGDLLLRAVPAIPEILRQGDVVFTEPGNVPRVIERRIVAAPVMLMGEVRRLAVSVHQQADGHWQYDLTFDNERTGGPAINAGGLATREGPVPTLERQPPRRASDPGSGTRSTPDGTAGGSTEGAADRDSVADAAPTLNLMVWGEVPAKTATEAETKATSTVQAAIDRHPLGPMVRLLQASRRVSIVSQAYDGAAPGVQAFTTPDGRISIVAPEISEADVMPVILHEAFHSGVRPLIGDAAWTGLMERLDRLHRQFERSPGKAGEFFAEARRRVGRAGVTGPLTAEEFGAYAIEAYEQAPRALRGWIDDVVGRVKAWALATFGRQIGAVTPAQLRALAAAAIRDQARGIQTAPVVADQNPIKDSVRDVAASAGAMLDKKAVADAVRGAATDIQPALLATVPLNYFSELKRPGMTSVDAYLQFKRQMDTYRGKRHELMVHLAEDWRKFASANRRGAEELSALMHDTTLAKFDPAAMAPDPADSVQIDLGKRWAALPPKAQQIYREVRDAFVEQQKELDDIILANIDKSQLAAQRKVEQAYRANLERIRADRSLTEPEKRERIERLEAQRENDLLRGQWAHKARMTKLRQQFESNRVPSPYFPLTRFGRYFVTIRNGEGDVVSFSRFEREADRRRWVRDNWPKIQQDFPGALKDEGVVDEKGDINAPMDPRLLGEIDILLGEAGVEPGVMDAIWQRYLQSMPDLSIRKRYIHRKGTSGFQQDALKGFASHMFHAAHQMARLKYAGDLTEALNGASDEARRADDPTRATTLVNELRKRHKWVMNPTGGKVAQAITSAMFAWYLAATPAAAIVNMTQPVMLGVPILGARFGGAAKAAAAMTKAVKDTVTGSGSIQNSASLSRDEQAAVRAFYESGLIERSQTYDLAGLGDTGVEYSPLRHRVMSIIGWGFHRAEIWNREVTALTAYRLAREAGQSHHAAVDTAHDLTWKVNFDYSNSNRPRILQGDVAKVVGTFQNFQINMWYRLFRDLHQSFKGDTPQARKEARYQLGGILGMMGLLGGVTGIAGYNVAMAIAGMFFGKDDDPFEFKHQVERSIIDLFGPTLGGIILKGAPGQLTGLDLTSRIGMPDFFLREPNGNKEGADWWKELMFSASGVFFSTIANTIRGGYMIAEGKTARGVEVIAPKAIRDVMKAYRYANEGVMNQRGDEVVSKDKISGWDLIAQASGFTPAHIAESFERNKRIREANQNVMRERRDLLNQFATAYRVGDAETRAAVVERIKQWNNRAYARGVEITGDTMRQSLRARMENAARREDGVLISNATLNRTLRDRLGQRVN
ncbi:PLxRFG domain-containing protein [Phreatobacter oligotrophus]|uniref:N12 class adenine-specific DNA methylase n=1 Tax=Phreatobacter oligotrophus TaxID=1122261 RepID=A0A2T4ZIV8_9HYPH|nr:PLxRFG domain-containing protein [Phreatobacter oligotrophus]PTM61923.1 N12 class adenine-specific DNA methylase [Phreatobacter oligotrophus]